jgi:hypothetical protein
MPISQSTRIVSATINGREARRIRTRVDNGDSHEDTSPRANSSHKVRRDGQQTENRTTKRSSGRNDPLELLVHASLAVTRHNHLLLLELLRDVARTRARNLDPRLREKGASGDHEGDVDCSVQRVDDGSFERVRWRHVVRDTADGLELGRTLHGLARKISK